MRLDDLGLVDLSRVSFRRNGSNGPVIEKKNQPMKLLFSRESVLVYQQKWLPTHYTVEFEFQAMQAYPISCLKANTCVCYKIGYSSGTGCVFG